MPEFTKVTRVSDMPQNGGKVIKVTDKAIAVFNVDGEFFAIDNTCTHVGGPLGEGELAGSTVTCPLHGARFDVKTGSVQGPPARVDVQKYEVKVEGEDILVAL